MKTEKKLANCTIGLHESLATSSHYSGIKEAVIHLACLTKKGEVLLVSDGEVWGFPKRTVPMAGALILFPNEIIKRELGRDPQYLRGVNPNCTDTKLLGQYVDDKDMLHIVLRVCISYTPSKQWMYVSRSGQLEQGGEFDEVVWLSAAQLGLASVPEEKVLQVA
jgi:hypothetical protein